MLQPKHKFLQLVFVLVISALGLQSVACAQAPVAQRQTETEENKALVRQWIEEGFNKRSLQIVDAIFVEALIINGQLIGRENLKRSMSRRLAAFPDLHVTIDAIIGEGNSVGMWYTAQGTHRGEFEGIPPNGRQVKWSGVDLFRIDGGKISQCTFVDDSLGLMRQLGATLSPPPAGD